MTRWTIHGPLELTDWRVPLAAILSVFLLTVLASPTATEDLPYTPVTTPNGETLAWEMEDGVKVFRLTVEEIKWEIAPGMTVKAWGYNGRTPGPTIEAVEGDRVRLYVTNKLPESTAIHWHGVLLPSGMDGVQGLSQRGIPPGETFIYEFTLKQNGTQMYHSHGDEMVQIGMGAMGFFIIHPKNPAGPGVDRDYAIMLSEWFVDPGTSTPNVNVMTDFNLFTMNSRAFPGTEPLMAEAGERVRIRFGNIAQEMHPIHLHGHQFVTTGTDAGRIPQQLWMKETTVTVAPGQTRDIEFTAAPGDWAMHCHRRHHPMNPMGHDVPNVLGVDQEGVADEIRELLPGYMAMGESGMEEHAEHAEHMPGPENTLPMMSGVGQYGRINMGGMFTVVKVRNRLKPGAENGWHDDPEGTVAEAVGVFPRTRSDETQDEESMEHGMSQGPSEESSEKPAEEPAAEHHRHTMEDDDG